MIVPQIRNKGLFFALCALAIAGCSSPKDPFSGQYTRPVEQCFSANEFAQMQGSLAGQNDLVNNNAAFINGHPMQYVVRKGDTLWDISGRFLRKPWYWRKIWRSNPHIKNPDLIYPGDVLQVVMISGQKYLTISESRNAYHGNDTGRRTRDGRPVVRFDPSMTDTTSPGLNNAISQSAIGPFLSKARIIGVDEQKNLPFIFGNGEQYLTLSQQDYIYTQNVQAPRGTKLWVYRKGEPILDHDAMKQEKYPKPIVIAQEMEYVGEVAVLEFDPVSGLTKLQPLQVSQTMQEGDVLMSPDEAVPPVNYFPQLPTLQCQRGYILSNTKKQTLNTTEFDTLVTSFGRDDGARIGDVWAIQRPGKLRMIEGNPVAVPGNTIGYLMIYKVYDRVSLGIVLDSTQPITDNDYLVRP